MFIIQRIVYPKLGIALTSLHPLKPPSINWKPVSFKWIDLEQTVVLSNLDGWPPKPSH